MTKVIDEIERIETELLAIKDNVLDHSADEFITSTAMAIDRKREGLKMVRERLIKEYS